METIEAKAFRTFFRIYPPFRSELLSANIKLTLYNGAIMSAMTYTCPAWEFAAETHLSKLQRLQNDVLHTIGNFQRCASVRHMHVAFLILNVYDYIRK
jgi:hypothetical protein